MRRNSCLRTGSAILGLAGLMLGALPASGAAAPAADRPQHSESEISKRAKALLAQMTPEEKAGQLSQYFYMAHTPLEAPVEKLIADGQVGSALFVSDPVTANKLQHIAMDKTRLKIPLLLGFDVIHGLKTIMPVPLGIAASWDPAIAEKAQSVAAAEARAVGIHWAFAPNVDIARDVRWGRIVEGAGEDPYLGAKMAAAQVRGFQGSYLGSPGHIIAGPKHFVGYGAAMGGRDYDEVQLSDSDLWNVYLPPFKAAIDAGAGNIMSAYMPLNGVPAVANRWLLTDVLRKTWGFKGFVVSDAAAVNSLTVQGLVADKIDAAGRALEAGLDMEMAVAGGKAAVTNLPAAIKQGKVSQDRVDDAVRRVLEMKLRMGLFEKPYVDEAGADRILMDPAHRQVALLAAERSAVLLRNEGGLLPLDGKKLGSIALIGPLADSERDMLGSWIFPVNKPQAVTVLQGLRTKLGGGVKIAYALGAEMPPRINPSPFSAIDPEPKRLPIDPDAEILQAVELAKQSDVAILALGEGQSMSGEAASRSSLDLPGRQQELLEKIIATGKPVVVLLFSARPLSLKGAKPSAILDMWYPGTEGGNAVANLLFGDAVPGGKLPITWLANVAHAPNPYAHLQSHDVGNADKRYWNEASNKPTYPFGYGLSYTTFEYSNLKFDNTKHTIGESVRVSADITNSGTKAADEVVQLYIHQRSGTSTRPVRELKGFQRLRLEPGQMRTVTFELKPQDLRYWSAVTRDWTLDPADFDVWVGGNSLAPLTGRFNLAR